MPAIYKFITAVIAVTGCASLHISGEIYPVVSLAAILLIPGYYRFISGKDSAPRPLIGLFSVFILIVFLLDSAVISGDVLLAVAHLSILFQVLKSFDLKNPWDPLQVFFMSLLQIIIASEFTQSVIFGIVFILYLVMLVTAMVLSHFIKEGTLGAVRLKRPVLAISVLTLVLTVFFFISFPRMDRRLFGKSHIRSIQTAGFSQRVDFGSFGNVKLDPTVVMRVELDRNIAPPYYWRGMSLNYFDGMSWTNTLMKRYSRNKTGDMFMLSDLEPESALGQTIYLEPIDSNVIFGLARIYAISTGRAYLLSDSGMGFYLRGTTHRRVNYTVYSDTARDYDGSYSRLYLQLPQGMERVAGLARELTSAQETTAQKAFVIEQYLKDNFTYSLDTRPPPGQLSPVEDFLFNTKSGFCEHYATSMAVMLRAVGVPSRIVNGFYGGERNDYGNYIIIKQKDSHSWVEALVDGKWKRYDPTPPVPPDERSQLALLTDSMKLNWIRYVVGFTRDDQKNILRGAVSPLEIRWLEGLKSNKPVYPIYFIFVAIILSFLVWAVLTRRRPERHGFATGKYLDLKRILRKRGIRITPAMTAGEIRTLLFRLGKIRYADEFLTMYEQYRFGGGSIRSGDREKFKRLIKEINSHLKNHPK